MRYYIAKFDQTTCSYDIFENVKNGLKKAQNRKKFWSSKVGLSDESEKSKGFGTP